MIKHLIYLSLIILLAGCCNKSKELQTGSFPKELNGVKATAYTTPAPVTVRDFNHNQQLKRIEQITYKNGLQINHYSYPSDLVAFSEYTLSLEPDYTIFKKGPGYTVNQQRVILTNSNIYQLIGTDTTATASVLNINAKTSIKLPKGIKPPIGSDKIFLEEKTEYPFFGHILQRSYLFKKIRLSSYEPLNPLNVDQIQKLTKFIQTQKVIETTEQYILYTLKEEPDNLLLWLPAKKVILFDFTQEQLEEIKTF